MFIRKRWVGFPFCLSPRRPCLCHPPTSVTERDSYRSVAERCRAAASPCENLPPYLKLGREENFSALADNWSFITLKYWHQFCCDFVLHFDIALYSQFGIELEKMRVLGSRFLKLLILYQRQLSKMLHGEERVPFHSALLTKLCRYFGNLKSSTLKISLCYKAWGLVSVVPGVVVTNPFNEELLALKRFYL